MATWLINNVSPASLGLVIKSLTYGSMAADTLTLEHLTAEWDADPLFAYGEAITLKREGVIVFVGKVRRFPRFAGPSAETTTYEIAGPWDWLERRALLQNHAVVLDPEVSTVPALVPQGLTILGQSDAGATVQCVASLTVVINQAITAGVAITLGTITGFDYSTAWDEVADLTMADAIVRLLGAAPDAVVWWDYTTASPTIHIGRRANLDAVTLAIADAGTATSDFEDGTYASFESIRLTSRPDLVVPGVVITYRRINTVNGSSYLELETQTAGTADATAENALVRTVQLAGSSFTSSNVEQKCVTAIIPTAIGTELTPASGTDFTAVLNFLARGDRWLVETGTTITKLTPSASFRKALVPDVDGVVQRVFPDTSLVRELVEGGITPWMESGGLNRKGEEQEISYKVEGTRTVEGVVTALKDVTVVRAFMATNVSTRTYSFQESSESTDAEPTPAGLATALYAAMSQLQHEGDFTLVQLECELTIRPGKVINLTNGRAEWATMKAVVQAATADPTNGTTQVQLGWPRHLTADDLTSICRVNRLKRPAERGLNRTTGT